jgi:hypothetical protein
MSRILISLLLLALFLQGCSAVEDLLPTQPDGVVIVATEPSEPEYIAPTLPPEYTLTPTATRTPTSPPSPTPFQVVTLEATEEPEGESSATATPVLFAGQWERYESLRLEAAIRVPPELNAYDFGQSIRVGSPNLYTSEIPLFLEILFDQANSYRLPDGIDATNSRNVLEAVLRELEQDYNKIQLVRAIQDVNFNGINASEVAARASKGSGETEFNINLYLAVAIRDETVVRFYASSPANAGVSYITIAERIADSFQLVD